MEAIDKGGQAPRGNPIFFGECYRLVTRRASGLGQPGFGHRRPGIARGEDSVLSMALRTHWGICFAPSDKLTVDALPEILSVFLMALSTGVGDIEMVDGGFRIPG